MNRTLLSLLTCLGLVGGLGEALHAQSLMHAADGRAALRDGTETRMGRTVAAEQPASGLEWTVEQAFLIGPLPATDRLVVTNLRPDAVTILGAYLQDARGQTLESGVPHGSDHVALGVGHLPRGTYSLVIRTSAGSVQRRVELI
jgi:hypothetical protein